MIPVLSEVGDIGVGLEQMAEDPFDNPEHKYC